MQFKRKRKGSKMANNYVEASSLIITRPEQREQAEAIIERIENEIDVDEENSGYINFSAEVISEGVWIYSDEYIDTNQVEMLVRALVEELDLPGIHTFSFSVSCSKKRIGEFGGGAFAIAKGQPTVWIDAGLEAEKQMVAQIAKSTNI
jgi:hypothetical protein